MPHFAAIALDRLIDPGASKPADKDVHGSASVHGHHLNPKSGSISNLRSKSTSSSQRKVLHPKMTPALYATPETPPPLPDSPTSFPPSPYIINHKRRGPCLVKNQPDGNASSLKMTKDEAEVSVGAVETSDQLVAPAEDILDVHHMPKHVRVNRDNGSFRVQSGTPGEAAKTKSGENENLNDGLLSLKMEGEDNNFYDPQESLSYTSNTDPEDHGTPDHFLKITSPGGEFFDAWEELSTDSTPHSSLRALEEELREIRLRLLMEIEKRKQAEDALQKMHNCWRRVREQLSLVGLSLIADPTVGTEQIGADFAEELSQQVYTARFVSEAVGRGIAKAEAEAVMEAQLEAKNFEIARLWDRLHYYEAVNREMSQRNQEAVETARRLKQIRKRKQRWVWRSIAATISIGAVALSCTYFPAGKGSSPHNEVVAPEHGDGTN